MKRILTLLALVAISICSYAYDFLEGGIYYDVSSSTTASVTYKDRNYNSYSGIVVVPSEVTHNGISYSVTGIGENAFSGCAELSYITIPNSVTSIGGAAFLDCKKLTSVIIPNSITSILGSAFAGCSGLTSITIPNSVTSIGWYAFSGCSNLISVTIPNSVTSIEPFAFNDCYGLTSVIIPNSVMTIGGAAFYNCKSLTSVTIPNSVTYIDTETFYNCISLTSVVIPNSVTKIGPEAFYNCKSLESVNIPERVTSIENHTFYGCEGLTSVTIPNSVTSIGKSAFCDCYGLTSITIPNSVTSIGDYAFGWCTNLDSVNISNSVRSIGKSAFCYCYLLTYVSNRANKPQSLYDEPFTWYDATLHVLKGRKEAYSNANYWQKFIIVDDLEAVLAEGFTIDVDNQHFDINVSGLRAKAIPTNDPDDRTVTWSTTTPSVMMVVAKTGDFMGLTDGVGELVATANDGSGVVAKAKVYFGTAQPDAIESIRVQEQHDDIIYNLNGTRVNSDNLPTGIYIKNGKKVIVK